MHKVNKKVSIKHTEEYFWSFRVGITFLHSTQKKNTDHMRKGR